MSRALLPRIDRCPHCDFRFRGRPQDHDHPSRFSRRLQWAGYLAFIPVMLAVAAFLALTRDERGLMMEFTGRANLIAFAIFSPSIALFVWSMLLPKRRTYRCPRCSWEHTFRAGDLAPASEPLPPSPQ